MILHTRLLLVVNAVVRNHYSIVEFLEDHHMCIYKERIHHDADPAMPKMSSQDKNKFKLNR